MTGLGGASTREGTDGVTQRVYLHVGAPKSGTTYIQGVLEHNRARLADAGVLVVGRAAPRPDPRGDGGA